MSMKVAIYYRLSEEDKNKQFESDDSGSIQNQKSMLLQYAMEQWWELYMDKVKNIISESDYVKMAREFATGRKRLERVITDGQKQLSEIEEKQAYSRHKGPFRLKFTGVSNSMNLLQQTTSGGVC